MDELNISAYIQIVQPAFMEHDKQESAGVFLFDSINLQELAVRRGFWTPNIDAKKISRLVSRQAPVPDEMKQASLVTEIAAGVVVYFEKTVVKDLNPFTKDDALEKLAKLIEIDSAISSKKKKSLLAFYEKDDTGKFLAETFLYVLSRPNKVVDDWVGYEDAPLLSETNYECPLCHNGLVEYVKDKPIKRYSITHVFPEDLSPELSVDFNAVHKRPAVLDSPSNNIALCDRCAESYLLAPTVEEYGSLYEIKQQLSNNYKARIAANKIELEESIRSILAALIDINETTALEELEYDALHLDEKFAPENFILKNETKTHVLHYYRYIEAVFSESGADFDTIASEIKMCSKLYENAGLSQEEVIVKLADWIRKRANMGENAKLPCNIVVSFFIQNCEVFHK